MQNLGQRLRKATNKIPRLQIQPRGEGAQCARAEQCVQLLAEDRDVQVADDPGTSERPKTQLFHAPQDLARGTVFLHEIDHGGAERFARRLTPQ